MATEKRLIDANAFKGKLIRELNKTGKYTAYECGLDDAISYLDEQPTVDAVEVVHGRWEWVTGDVYRCTNCGEKSHVKEVMGQPDFDYCPNCGVKMDGDVDG